MRKLTRMGSVIALASLTIGCAAGSIRQAQDPAPCSIIAADGTAGSPQCTDRSDAAYGFSAKRDLLAQLLALNQQVAANIEHGSPVTVPGVPKHYPDAKKLVTEDCIRPRALMNCQSAA